MSREVDIYGSGLADCTGETGTCKMNKTNSLSNRQASLTPSLTHRHAWGLRRRVTCLPLRRVYCWRRVHGQAPSLRCSQMVAWFKSGRFGLCARWRSRGRKSDGSERDKKAANRPYHVFTRKESKNNRRKAKGTQYIDLVFVEVPIGMAFLPAPTKLRKTVGRQAPL